MTIAIKWTWVGAVLCVAGCGNSAASTPSEHADEHSHAQAVGSAGAAAKPNGAAAGSGAPTSSASMTTMATMATMTAMTTMQSAGKAGAGSTAQSASAGTASTAPMGTASAGAPGAAAADGGGAAGMSAAAGSGAPEATEKFSFFVTSLQGMRDLSKNEQGFGGDLRYGESTGLKGADKICTELAESSMPGAGAKGWHAFLSAAKAGDNGGPVHAKDRIGKGPWYDRLGRLVAMNVTDLLNERPKGADPAIIDDLPNERGEPNHTDTMPDMDDNHDVVTATDAKGMWDGKMTCEDWTSTMTPVPPMMEMDPMEPTGPWNMMFADDGPGLGHSWPSEFSGSSWMAVHRAPGCSPSVALVQMGGGQGTGIGNGGGYGGIYCFALKP